MRAPTNPILTLRMQNGPEDQWALSDVQELCPELGEGLAYSPFPKPDIYPGYSGTVVQLNGTDITPCIFTVSLLKSRATSVLLRS